jgi:hypothetical protein
MYRLKTLIILVLIIGLGACDVLENQQPQQSLPVDGGLDTISELQNALNGTYSDFQTPAFRLFGNEILADDAVWTGSFPTFVEVSARNMVASNGSIEGFWEGGYIVINDANIILESLDVLDDPVAEQAAIDNVRGQALFIRALSYYYLVNYFAQPSGFTSDDSHLGVPLQLTAVTGSDDFAQPLRSSVAEVYTQINSDLTAAEGLLSAGNPPNRATPSAATAFRARIALVRSNFSQAATLAGQVIPNYTLLPDVTTYFRNELSAESIFEVQYTVQDNPGAANTNMTAVHAIGSRDDIQINETYVDALDSILNTRQEALNDGSVIDTRRTRLITGLDENGNIITRSQRDQYSGGESNTFKYESDINDEDNLPIIRLPEMILTRAEALAETQGVNQESIDLLNQIRRRAFIRDANGDGEDDGTTPVNAVVDYTAADFTSPQELIDAIFLERRVELSYEGHRTTDLQRRKMDVRGLPYDSPIITFPIPQTQIDVNPDLTQNPAYVEGGS